MDTLQTDLQTDRQSAKDIIRAFLDLPSTDLPAARMDDPDTDAWAVIRAYMADEAGAYLGEEVWLSARRAAFRDGVRIELV